MYPKLQNFPMPSSIGLKVSPLHFESSQIAFNDKKKLAQKDDCHMKNKSCIKPVNHLIVLNILRRDLMHVNQRVQAPKKILTVTIEHHKYTIRNNNAIKRFTLSLLLYSIYHLDSSSDQRCALVCDRALSEAELRGGEKSLKYLLIITVKQTFSKFTINTSAIQHITGACEHNIGPNLMRLCNLVPSSGQVHTV